jgi:tetratricopeptide (TPR) repeat protein
MKRAVLIGLLCLLALLGLLRLNSFCLLEPDSPDYLFTSRALATLDGYREIDHPDEPLHSFRPPGLPALLVPLSLVAPYNVVLAKFLVLATAMLMVALVLAYARRVSSGWSPALITLLVLSSPYTLLHATEVMTEVPFIAMTLGVLVLLSREERTGDWATTGGVTVLLAALPFVRTIGVALIAAVGVWGLIRRSRWRWAAAATLSTIPTLIWFWRNSRTGGVTYGESILSSFSSGGAVQAVGAMGRDAGDYLIRLCDLLLPGVRSGQPLYERVMLDSAPDLGGLWGLALPLAAIVLALALLGIWGRRHAEGPAVVAYLLLFLVALAVYPPKHERLTWPLVPLVWIYAAAGSTFLTDRIARARRGWLRPVATAGTAAVLALAVWQGVACGAMVQPNVQRWLDADRFHAEQFPPTYYCDWQSAGRWIGEHSSPRDRVLTRHSDVGFGSRRYQDSVRFEELSPAAWRQRLAGLRARYLVVPTNLCGRLFRWEALQGDAVYTYSPVYETGDIVVLEVGPNRTGTVRAGDPRHEKSIAECREAVRLHPRRIDLQRRMAELLVESGETETAVERLRELIDDLGDDARLYESLGRAYLEHRVGEDALRAFEVAASLPEAGFLESRIERGKRRAREMMNQDESRSDLSRALDLVELSRWQMKVLDHARAEESTAQALELAPEEPSVLFARAELLQRLGRTNEALPVFEALRQRGDTRAVRKLELLRLDVAIRNGVAGHDPSEHLRLAVLCAQDGLPGKALDVLERAVARFPDSPELMPMLGELYLFFGMAEEGEATFRRALEAAPGDPRARDGLDTALAMKSASF